MPASDSKRLAILGAGPKAVALAAKAQVLNELGYGPVETFIIEEHCVAAHWAGAEGFTDGEQHLGTPPEKDIGFPYRSIFGQKVNKEMLNFSWPMFLIDKGEFSDWIDRGRPQPAHARWAEYLDWACHKAALDIFLGKLLEIGSESGKLVLKIRSRDSVQEIPADGLVLTGPGNPLPIAGIQDDDPEDILNGRNYWQRIPIFSGMKQGRVAVIGGGETAASIVLSLLRHSPNLEIDLINRHGTVYTRGEGFHENRVFSVTEEWVQMDEIDREDFMKRTDRGVFSVAAKRIIDHALNVRTRAGHISAVQKIGNMVNVRLSRKNGQHYDLEYNKVVVAIGFDPFSQLSLIRGYVPPRDKDEVRRFRQGVDNHLRAPVKLPHTDGEVNIHMPMLAGLSQGPGFPNLSCLGTLSDRILSLYAPERSLTKIQDS